MSPLSGQERAGAAAGSCPTVLVDAGCAEGRGCLGDSWFLHPELTPSVALCRHRRRGLTDVPEAFGCAGAIPPWPAAALRFPTSAHPGVGPTPSSHHTLLLGGQPVLGSVRVAPVPPRADSPANGY